MINNLIQNPQLTNNSRQKLNLVLYKAYEKWAIKKALEFKTLHKYKCQNIKKEDLIFSSKIGLFKSIQKYNGKYDLINYSIIYINSELLKIVTEKYALSIVSKYIRNQNKSNFSSIELNKYKKLLNVKLFCEYEKINSNPILLNVINEDILTRIKNTFQEKEKYTTLLCNLSPFEKRILHLKYELFNNKIMSNKHISKLMCCSEEKIRKQLIEIKRKIHK
jgi:DNA-directed RNA polymerase sigma subunit (sigma70/sigma32)